LLAFKPRRNLYLHDVVLAAACPLHTTCTWEPGVSVHPGMFMYVCAAGRADQRMNLWIAYLRSSLREQQSRRPKEARHPACVLPQRDQRTGYNSHLPLVYIAHPATHPGQSVLNSGISSEGGGQQTTGHTGRVAGGVAAALSRCLGLLPDGEAGARRRRSCVMPGAQEGRVRIFNPRSVSSSSVGSSSLWWCLYLPNTRSCAFQLYI
jgi:hypothetical protein